MSDSVHSPGTPETLDAWLQRISGIHPVGWDLGLERVSAVGEKMDLLHPADTVVLIAGTNGKGSTCEFLDRFGRAAGLTVGKSTSPHILRFNERIQVNGQPVSDDRIVTAFRAIDEARGDITLTYFEFASLASMYIFRQAQVDLAILEVGLGGRLDAMNIVSPDLTIITSIAMDHEAWLGDNREAIAREKAGIMRPGIHCIVADRDPPAALAEEARRTGAMLAEPDLSLPVPPLNLPGDSFHAACRAAELLNLQLDEEKLREIAVKVSLPGRRTWRKGRCPVLLDVAHNPAAASDFADYVAGLEVKGDIHALLGMYRDKDVERVTAALAPLVKTWHLTDLPEERAESAAVLADRLAIDHHGQVATYANIDAALKSLDETVTQEDLVLVFGSFPVVAGALGCFSNG